MFSPNPQNIQPVLVQPFWYASEILIFSNSINFFTSSSFHNDIGLEIGLSSSKMLQPFVNQLVFLNSDSKIVVPINFGLVSCFTPPLIRLQHSCVGLKLQKSVSRRCKYFSGIALPLP
jgi:hypothetical protein